MGKEERIVVNPKVMVGKPVIKGTRISVDAIIRRLAERMSVKRYWRSVQTLPKMA